MPLGTGPSEVGGLKVHITVSTTLPAGCSTVIVALVKARSSIVSVQLGLGQSGAPAMIGSGGNVVTLKGVVPFLISSAGIAWLPITVRGAGFWPGAWLPPWFVQVEVTSAVASSVTKTSAFPRPASAPEALRVRPPSVKEGLAFFPPFRWTLAAKTADTERTNTSSSVNRMAEMSVVDLVQEQFISKV